MRPREFQWKETESRGAVIPLVREVGKPDVAHVAVWFDDARRVVWVGIWWAPGTPAYERPAVLQRCTDALREWKGLGDYEPRVVAPQGPYRSGQAPYRYGQGPQRFGAGPPRAGEKPPRSGKGAGSAPARLHRKDADR